MPTTPPMPAVIRPLSRPLAALLSLLAVAALLQSTLFAIADPSLLGWRPDHGHLFAGGEAHAHVHPSDHAAGGAPADLAGGSNAGVVFTADADGAAGSVVSALTLPDAAIALAASAAAGALAVPELPVPVGVPQRVPSPPPRG